MNLQKVYEVLAQQGMIDMSFEEFQQLPEEQIMSYMQQLEQGMQQPQEQPAEAMQPQQPMMEQQAPVQMGYGGRYQDGGSMRKYQKAMARSKAAPMVQRMITSDRPEPMMQDGYEITHRMAEMEDNNNYIIAPTVAMDTSGKLGEVNPWDQVDNNNAIYLPKNKFSKDEAEWFGRQGYKVTANQMMNKDADRFNTEGFSSPPKKQEGGNLGWDWTKKDGSANVAGQFGTQLGSMTGNFVGNMLQKDQPESSARNIAGDMLSSTAQGAATGSMFGPLGSLIGAGIGAVGGGIKAAVEKKQLRDRLKEERKPRDIGSLGTAYNPELKMGGRVSSAKAEIGEVMKARFNPGGNYTSRGKNQVGRAGFGPDKSFNERKTYRYGGPILKKYQDGGNAEAEIEGGEAVIGNPQDMTMFGGATAENVSPVGFMAKGAQHGQKNQAGSEGIPVETESDMYIGSDKLTLKGFPAGKRYGKSVAKEMRPYLQYMEKSADSLDRYRNNKEATKAVNNQLSKLQSQAEEGKFMKELKDMLSKKGRDYKQIMQFIKEQNPNEFSPVQDVNISEMRAEPMGGGDLIDPTQGGAPEAMLQEGMMRYGGRMKSTRSKKC